MEIVTLQNEVAEIQRLLEERLKVRGRTFDAQVRKAGRRLPKSVRRDAEYLASASLLLQNPKLARMIDPTKVEKAHALVVRHLKSIDPGKQRLERLLNTAAVFALNLLIIGGLAIAFLLWRGVL